MSDTPSSASGNSHEHLQQQKQAIAAMLDVQWNTNWSDMPGNAEQHVERAFEHLCEARDIVEAEQ